MQKVLLRRTGAYRKREAGYSPAMYSVGATYLYFALSGAAGYGCAVLSVRTMSRLHFRHSGIEYVAASTAMYTRTLRSACGTDRLIGSRYRSSMRARRGNAAAADVPGQVASSPSFMSIMPTKLSRIARAQSNCGMERSITRWRPVGSAYGEAVGCRQPGTLLP